jgi:hypothetical protein
MSVLVIAQVPGGSAEQDEAMVKTLSLGSASPSGARFRVAGPSAGGWRIVSLWESREAFDAFLNDRIRPALEAAGRSVPDFEYWPIESEYIY